MWQDLKVGIVKFCQSYVIVFFETCLPAESARYSVKMSKIVYYM